MALPFKGKSLSHPVLLLSFSLFAGGNQCHQPDVLRVGTVQHILPEPWLDIVLGGEAAVSLHFLRLESTCLSTCLSNELALAASSA